MKILKSTSLEHAADMAIQEISSEYKRICLTGGRFGEIFSKRLQLNKMDISLWEIFLTDERLNCLKQDEIRTMLLPNLERVIGFKADNFNPFEQGHYRDSYESLLNKIEGICFDITFLSLGEDGHLAGQFKDSKLTSDNRFCYTDNATKEPKQRVSFTVNYLFNSKKVVLAVLGEKKRKALIDFYEGRGLYANFYNRTNLILITDIDI